MKIDLTQFRQTFLQESAEHAATMESALLALRSTPDDTEVLNAIFRSAHSIKGGAGSFGLENLVRFTHALENLLERLRALEIPATAIVIATLLESIDILRALLEPGTETEMPGDAVKLIERIEALTNPQLEPQCGPEVSDIPAHCDGEPKALDVPTAAIYKIEFSPDREMFSSGTNPIVMLRNLTELGQVSATELHAEDLPTLFELDPTQCYLRWTVEMATIHPEEELREVFEFVEHLAEISIRRIDAIEPAHIDHISANAVNAKAPSTRPLEPVLAIAPSAKPTVADTTPLSSPSRSSRTKPQAKATAGGESSSIRVATDKVDRLIDLVGELVIAHVMTAQMVQSFTPECLPKLRESVAAMERNTRELHERVMSVRMLPVGTLFQRYARIVYDIAQVTGKKIALETAGEDTEIDKSMLELLGDPLTHLIRNAADHGIESPAARLAAGKAEEGTICLRAFHRAGRVVIEVSDDGAGIDPARVRTKAIERGMIAAGAQLSDEQLRMLIFEPGFSTREEVSDLSGRGVGMDVVKQNVHRLNGAVTLSSEIGQGSTVCIELPLTLAILEGLLVRVADRTLVLPLLSVVETVSPLQNQMQRLAEQGEVVVIRGESVPLLRLSRFLGLPDQSTSSSTGSAEQIQRSLIVIVETGRKKIGLVVDELLGQQQVVVKSLERHLRKVDGLMGATILGDGCVAPIIDVTCLAGMNLYSLHQAETPSSPQEITARIFRATSSLTKEIGETTNELV